MNGSWCWIYRNYVLISCLLILLYLLGAFLAPVFQYFDIDIPAKLTYAFYSTTCHQFAFRSWFLFGDQTFYPLEKAGLPMVSSYEEVSGNSTINIEVARQFIGDETIGYKVALCQRDVAIFVGLFILAVGFELSKRKWQPIPVILWIVLGVFPILLDGISQFGGSTFPIFNFFPGRESNPAMRTLTGLFFGVTTGLYLFPKLEIMMKIVKNNHRCEES
ncbi:MAG TPA: hypothetical protein DCK95_04670 [Anaerolineaceae bacterium]|uniref:Putative membrane protein n=1 Tax=Anaerolinea thermophila TaxID=167964 RepID=A0A101FXF2_9CHLR|nr:MAG: putative membrane protein [Anaerolinea thermophila]HAF61600.1 hypothetical protein [Anaerolineaceae bacterium]